MHNSISKKKGSLGPFFSSVEHTRKVKGMNILKLLTASFLAVMLSFPVYAGEAKDKVKVGFIYVNS